MKKQPKDKLPIYKRKLRKHENILIVSGIAVFAFAVWDLVKMVLYLTLDNSFFEDFIIPNTGEDYSSAVAIVSVILTILLYVAVIVFRLFIFQSAYMMGRRGKNKTVFIILAMLAGIVTLVSLSASITSLISLIFGATDELAKGRDQFATFIMDTTSMMATFDLVISGISVKVLRKKVAREEEKQ